MKVGCASSQPSYHLVQSGSPDGCALRNVQSTRLSHFGVLGSGNVPFTSPRTTSASPRALRGQTKALQPSNGNGAPLHSPLSSLLSLLTMFWFGRRHLSAGEVLPVVLTVNQLTYDIADAMQIGPLKGVAAILGRILDTAQKVQGNKAACLRLVRRATTFILSVRDRMDGKWDSALPGVKEAVDRFEGLLKSISDSMTQLARATLWTRIRKQSRIRDAIADFEQRLNDQMFVFQNSVLLEIHHTYQQTVVVRDTTLVEQVQAMHMKIEQGFARGLSPADEDGFPLIHRSEIVLHGEVPHAGGWWCGLEEATVKGRPVLIKHYNGRNARKRRKEDLAFLKSIWNARFPQLYGVSQTTSTTPFILLHNVGTQDIRAFVTPYLQQGNLLEVAAIATRVAEHLRAGLKMLASTGRWPAISSAKVRS